MNKYLKQKAIQLRLEKQLSYGAIQKELFVAKSTLSDWLKPFPLSREKIIELRRLAWKNSEAKIELFRTTMRERRENQDVSVYKIYLKHFTRIPDIAIFTSGLILYLAEGSKTSNYRVSLANTDPRVLKFFVKWLYRFFKVKKDKLRVHLHLYEGMDLDKEKEFWKNELEINEVQFYKPFITKYKKSSFLYKESFRHGTCSVIISSTELKRKIMMAIKAYLDSAFAQYKPRA